FSKPVQVHWARALAGPFRFALASPVSVRRNGGITRTLDCGLPRHSTFTSVGRGMLPRLPSLPPPSAPASPPLRSVRRSTGEKYADRSPNRQVVPPAARLPLVDWPFVVRLPT